MLTIEQMKQEVDNYKKMMPKYCTQEVKISINPRLSKTLGRCCFNKNNLTGQINNLRIEISKRVLEDERLTREVLKHEFIHWYCAASTGENHGHDDFFKKQCKYIGAVEERLMNPEYTEDLKSKYEVYCCVCGGLVAKYARKSQTLKNINYCRSTCCEGKLKVVQNW